MELFMLFMAKPYVGIVWNNLNIIIFFKWLSTLIKSRVIFFGVYDLADKDNYYRATRFSNIKNKISTEW